ncbi:MAG: FMN-binding glutamate synthase family protein [Mariniblastus sp.]|nr:FMN-binding glutamate synthase family protein [Mariniblastus sp.]
MAWLIVLGILLVIAIRDCFQKRHPVLRNYPLIGHGRYLLEELGPKLRQYIVASNNEERPFTRDQRKWVYSSADKENNYFGFGTDNDLEHNPGYLIIKHSAFPVFDTQPEDPNYDPHYHIPSAKILGGARGRKHAFRPNSIINVSAMSYGSLSAAAVEAINRGCKIAGCMQNTGEGGVSPYHDHGGDLIWQLGTGYYGARLPDGRFDENRFVETCQKFDIKSVEIKLSQGAKPGRGGVLPAKKVTAEIAAIRGIEKGQSCLSPNSHFEFSNPDELLDFVERLAEKTGLPTGIKSAVGEMEFWRDLVALMESGTRGVDFIAIDGGEGGTGAAPLTFSDHVSMPFKMGFARVFREFADRGLHEKVTFIGSGKLGFPEQAILAMAMGCDTINIAREAMMAIGCIQAQVCHTGKCPTGVATQNKWLMRGLDPTDKGARLANYIVALRKEILQLCHACGVNHPAMITTDSFDILNDGFQSRSAKECFRLQGITTVPSAEDREAIAELMKQYSSKQS